MVGFDAAGLMVTIAMIAVLIFGIVKKANAALALLVSSMAGAIYFTAVEGSMLGDASTGSKWIDIFEYISRTISGQLTTNILILGALMGFITYCDHCKATTMLCLLLTRPLSRFKKRPMVMVVVIMVFEVMLTFVIQSNNAQIAMMFATLFPIMVALGVTKETAATAMAFSAYIEGGPANGLTAMYFAMGGERMSIAEYFMTYELWNIIISGSFSFVVFVLTSKIFDKLDKCEPSPSSIDNIDVSNLGCPRWYAIFPLTPVFLIIIFSGLVVRTVIISVPAAAIIVWIVMFIVEFLRSKDKLAAVNDTIQFWKGFGDIIWQVGSIIVTATLFSGVMTKIGALAALFGRAVSGGSSFAVMLIVVSLVAAALSVLNGNPTGAVSLFGSIMAGICSTMNIPFVTAVRTLMPVTCTGTAMSPISNSNLYCAAATKVDILTIVKRCVPPTVAFFIATFIVTMVFM
jgi:DcuC family C4-dicarboxylate transporter